MHTSLKTGLLALTAALLLATAVSTATARNLSLNSTTFRVTWREIQFDTDRVVCELTLEGSFHYRTIAKVRGSLIGLITKAIIRHPCQVSEGWMDNETERPLGAAIRNTLPWHLTYEEFLGTLPRITGTVVLIRNMSSVVNVSGICLGRYGTATDNISALADEDASGNLGTVTPVAGRNRLTLRERLGGIFCPGTAGLTGTGNVTQLNSTSRIVVTLI